MRIKRLTLGWLLAVGCAAGAQAATVTVDFENGATSYGDGAVSVGGDTSGFRDPGNTVGIRSTVIDVHQGFAGSVDFNLHWYADVSIYDGFAGTGALLASQQVIARSFSTSYERCDSGAPFTAEVFSQSCLFDPTGFAPVDIDIMSPVSVAFDGVARSVVIEGITDATSSGIFTAYYDNVTLDTVVANVPQTPLPAGAALLPLGSVR